MQSHQKSSAEELDEKYFEREFQKVHAKGYPIIPEEVSQRERAWSERGA